MLSPIATAILIALKIQLPPQFTPALKSFFIKGEVPFNTEEIAFDKIKKGRKLAPFVSPMIAGKPQKSKGGTMTTVSPAYIKVTDVVSGTRLLKRQPGEALLGTMTPEQRLNAIRADILVEQEESIDRREEWMVCEVLKTGAVTIEGEDFKPIQIDYGRSPQNNITLAGVDRWSTLPKATSEKPINDIEEWAERCTVVADVIVMGKTTWREFRSFKSVKDLLDTRRGSMSVAEAGPLANKSFKWVARMGEFEIYVYSGAYEDKDGTVTSYFDDNGLLITSSDLDLHMAYGAITDVKANAQGIVEATRYPSNWYTDNPSVEWLQTQAAPIPVLLDADEAVYVRV